MKLFICEILDELKKLGVKPHEQIQYAKEYMAYESCRATCGGN